MVLGLILYETVDVIYNVSKIGYNSVRGIYYWYYNEETPETKLLEEKEQYIQDLEIRLARLEKKYPSTTKPIEDPLQDFLLLNEN